MKRSLERLEFVLDSPRQVNKSIWIACNGMSVFLQSLVFQLICFPFLWIADFIRFCIQDLCKFPVGFYVYDSLNDFMRMQF